MVWGRPHEHGSRQSYQSCRTRCRGFPPIRPGMRETLRSHKEAFVHWRYLYENSTGMFQTAAIEEVLAATIDVYDKAVDESP